MVAPLHPEDRLHVDGLHLLDGRPWSDSPWVDPLSLLGCYTSFAVDASGGVVDLDAHLARLRTDSTVLLGQALTDDVVRTAAADHVARVGAPTRLRVAVLAQTLPLQPQEVLALHLATSSRPLPPVSHAVWTVRTEQHVRTLPQVKAVAPYGQLHRKRQARLAGYDDVLLARGDDLLEGTSWGLAALTATSVVVPLRDVLPSLGAARVAAATGLPVERRAVRRDELAGLRLLLATTALTPATPVGQVDGQRVAVDAGLLARLQAACAQVPATPLHR